MALDPSTIQAYETYMNQIGQYMGQAQQGPAMMRTLLVWERELEASLFDPLDAGLQTALDALSILQADKESVMAYWDLDMKRAIVQIIQVGAFEKAKELVRTNAQHAIDISPAMI